MLSSAYDIFIFHQAVDAVFIYLFIDLNCNVGEGNVLSCF